MENVLQQKTGRFWANRGDDGIEREKQLLIDYLCSNAGGPVYYTGRDMKLTHAGATMQALQTPQQECDDIVEV